MVDTGRYVYDVTPWSDVDKIITYEESDLVFQYHDSLCEEIFTEKIGWELPPWRSRLYNFYMFYDRNWQGNLFINIDLMPDYNNHIIPPVYMEHILDEHSMYKRIDVVLSDNDNREKIKAALDITDDKELESLKDDLQFKIFRRNIDGMFPEVTKDIDTRQRLRDFTPDERALAAQVDILDIVTENHVKLTKDHYPLDYTNFQIMQAIKEAYNGARKIGSRKMEKVKDRRTGEKSDPIKGKILYEGISKDNLVIQFWYNFDLDLIESAYPVKMNNNVKKHVTESVQITPAKYSVGTRVKVVSGRGVDQVGVIKESFDPTDGENKYFVRLDGERSDRVYFEHNLELEGF